MTKFIIQRLLTNIPLLIGISVICFLMVQLVPGDPVINMLGEYGASAEIIEQLREELGLNDPLHVQYWNYFIGILHGDLGTSIRLKKPVLDAILEGLPRTVELTFAGLGFAILFGASLGIISALNHNSWLDNLIQVISVAGVSVPSFWLGLMFIFLFALRLGWLPVLGSSGGRGLILPSLTLGLYAAGTIARLVRSGTLEVMGQDYVRTARAKGLSERIVVFRHMLRNALIPIVTVVGLQFGYMLGGSTVIEMVFARPGMGRLTLYAIVFKDYPLVQGCVLFAAIVYLIVNLLVEIAYTWIDPRIRFK